MSLQPATPEHGHLMFTHGVLVSFAQFAFLESPYLSDDCFPRLAVFDRWQDSYSTYRFDRREECFIVFRTVDDFIIPESNGESWNEFTRRSMSARHYKKIPLNQWTNALALHFDCLAAHDAESLKVGLAEGPAKYHVILEERDQTGKTLARRLLYSMHSRQAADYALRQHRIWQEYLWNFYNMRDIHAESVFTKHRTLTPILDSYSESKLKVLTEYPYSRGKKRPYIREWHWHISHLIPLIEAGDSGKQVIQDREDERWQHRPGDPKLLRETGSGYFGSYPAYEGDEEPEYRDEN